MVFRSKSMSISFNINYLKLVKSVVIPGLVFSLFVIYAYILNKGLSDSNKEIIFFDGRRMVGMLMTFLVVFYLKSNCTIFCSF